MPNDPEEVYAFILKQTDASLLRQIPPVVEKETTDMLRNAMESYINQVLHILRDNTGREGKRNFRTFRTIAYIQDACSQRMARMWIEQNRLDPVWQETASIRFQTMGLVHWLCINGTVSSEYTKH